MMSHSLFQKWILMNDPQPSSVPVKSVPVVMKDEDGDVIMQDAPGANPEPVMPLIDQWMQEYRMGR